MKSRRLMLAKKKHPINNTFSSITYRNNVDNSFISSAGTILNFCEEDEEEKILPIPIPTPSSCSEVSLSVTKTEIDSKVRVTERDFGLKEIIDEVTEYDLNNIDQMNFEVIIKELKAKLSTYQEIYFENQQKLKIAKDQLLNESDEENDEEEGKNEPQYQKAVLFRNSYLWKKMMIGFYNFFQKEKFKKRIAKKNDLVIKKLGFEMLRKNLFIGKFQKKRKFNLAKRLIKLLRQNFINKKEKVKEINELFLKRKTEKVEMVYNDYLKFMYLSKLCFASMLSIQKRKGEKVKEVHEKIIKNHYFSVWIDKKYINKKYKFLLEYFKLKIRSIRQRKEKTEKLLQGKLLIKNQEQLRGRMEYYFALKDCILEKDKKEILNIISKTYLINYSSWGKITSLILKKKYFNLKLNHERYQNSIRFLIKSSLLSFLLRKRRNFAFKKKLLEEKASEVLKEISEIESNSKKLALENEDLAAKIKENEDIIQHLRKNNKELKEKYDSQQSQFKETFHNNLNQINELQRKLQEKNSKNKGTNFDFFNFSLKKENEEINTEKDNNKRFERYEYIEEDEAEEKIPIPTELEERVSYEMPVKSRSNIFKKKNREKNLMEKLKNLISNQKNNQGGGGN